MDSIKMADERIEDLKETKPTMGVFQIQNNINDKIWVSSSDNLDATWSQNKAELNRGKHPNNLLQRDWTIVGEGNFTFSILKEMEQKEISIVDADQELKAMETTILNKLKPFGMRGYNKN